VTGIALVEAPKPAKKNESPQNGASGNSDEPSDDDDKEQLGLF
jgi:hypothetical protein